MDFLALARKRGEKIPLDEAEYADGTGLRSWLEFDLVQGIPPEIKTQKSKTQNHSYRKASIGSSEAAFQAG
jgi:hypothetical protein